MPIVQNQPTPKGGQQPYGVVANSNNLSFQERLMKRFAAHEYVTVKNVDNETFRWQYLPAHLEEHEFTTDPMKITHRGEPEVWEMEPGAEETIVGANAYIMIEQLYKNIVAKKRTKELKNAPPMGRNFNFSDVNQQEYWINQILIGKAVPTFGATQPEGSSLEPIEHHPRLTKPSGVGPSH